MDSSGFHWHVFDGKISPRDRGPPSDIICPLAIVVRVLCARGSLVFSALYLRCEIDRHCRPKQKLPTTYFLSRPNAFAELTGRPPEALSKLIHRLATSKLNLNWQRRKDLMSALGWIFHHTQEIETLSTGGGRLSFDRGVTTIRDKSRTMGSSLNATTISSYKI